MSNTNRRQPTRSVRTSTTRPSNYYARPYGFPGAPTGSADNDVAEDVEPGFFPAITHFTDGVAALPKEVMRHLTLLRETEGKAFAPDRAIADIVTAIKKLPPPPKHSLSTHMQPYLGFSLTNSVNGSTTGSMIDGHMPQSRPATSDSHLMALSVDPHADMRRMTYYGLRERLKEVIGILDEKNMVLATANETLAKQLARLDNTLPHVELEVSEEARLGSNTHWALPHMKELRKVAGVSNERARREIQSANNLAAAAAVVGEQDLPPSRSETRREAVQAKRKNHNNVDSDFDDRPGSRKAQVGAKARKGPEVAAMVETKSAVPRGQILPPTKRRRIDKPPTSNDRAVGGPSGKAGHSKDSTSASRDASATDGGRKKTKPSSMEVAARKRNAANSPAPVSSPIRGIFTTTTAPAPSNPSNGRTRDQSPTPYKPGPSSGRPRHDSMQSIKASESRIRNGASVNGRNNGATKASTPDLKATADVTGRTVGEARAAVTDSYRNSYGERMIEEEGMSGVLIHNSVKVTSDSTNKRTGRELKREETVPAEAEDIALPARAEPGMEETLSSVPMAVTRSRNGITKAAKPTTPVNIFNEAPPLSRSRSTRGINAAQTSSATAALSPQLVAVGSPRRTNKRGVNNHTHSLASPSRSSGSSVDGRHHATSGPVPAASATGSTTSARPKTTRRSPQARSPSPSEADLDADGDAEDDNGQEFPSSPASDEPRYCVCGGVSYGDMIACDNDTCPREWFHLQCVGLTKVPGSKVKWYCDECKDMLRRGSRTGA